LAVSRAVHWVYAWADCWAEWRDGEMVDRWAVLLAVRRVDSKAARSASTMVGTLVAVMAASRAFQWAALRVDSMAAL
jgi:hypothetical protein